jgi:hypothetical protein
MFKNSIDWSVSYWNDFETKTDFDQWMDERMKEGLVYIGEKSKEIPAYPQVLRLDLKYILGGYYTTIERFSSSEEYTRYCDWKLSQGYKVIGSAPYMELKTGKENGTN